MLHTALPQAAHAAAGTLTKTTSGGLWSDTANWSGGIIADGNFNANFSTIDINAANTVSLNSARTIGSLTFIDTVTGSAASWIINNNGSAANTLTLATATITVIALGTGATANISAVIAGTSATLTKNGASTLVLSGANTYTKVTNNAGFATELDSGTLVIASDSAFGATTGTGFNTTGLLNLNGSALQASGSARTVGNPIWLNGSTTVVSGSESLTFSGTGSGRGGNPTVTNNITGTGTLSLTGNVYTDFSTGLKLLTFGGSGNTLISGAIANNTANVTGQNGAITKSGNGTLTLANIANTYTRVTTISASVVEAAALTNGSTSSSIGQSTNAASNLIFGAPTATLRYNGGSNATTDCGFTLSSGAGSGATIESSGIGTLTINNTVALAYGTANETRLLTLGGPNIGANTFSKVIANNGSGATSLTKAGTGTWILSAANTYTGNTTVSAGTLTLDPAGSLKYVPTVNGVCNKITGAGTATLNGTFNIDLTNAAIANGNSWTLVDTTTKNGTLTAVTGFSGSSGVWNKVDGSSTWTFTESPGLSAGNCVIDKAMAVVVVTPLHGGLRRQPANGDGDVHHRREWRDRGDGWHGHYKHDAHERRGLYFRHLEFHGHRQLQQHRQHALKHHRREREPRDDGKRSRWTLVQVRIPLEHHKLSFALPSD